MANSVKNSDTFFKIIYSRIVLKERPNWRKLEGSCIVDIETATKVSYLIRNKQIPHAQTHEQWKKLNL